jgi:hypothetical protein
MKLEDYPNLLIVKELTTPIDLSSKRLQEISEQADDSKSELVVQGLFVMAIASLEVMLSDVFLYFLTRFPQQLPKTEFKFEKGVFFDNYFTLSKKAAESYINTLFYKSFEDYFKKGLELFSIDWPDFLQTIGVQIREIRATRNVLLHNSLVVNDQYLGSAGPKIREERKGRTLVVDVPYLRDTVGSLLDFESQLKTRLMNKYIEYTKRNANRRLWNFLFDSPVMLYDDFWQYDEESDRISSMGRGQHEGRLAYSEKLLLSLWRAHYYEKDDLMARFNMRHFDSSNQEKVLFFLSIAADFPFE